MDNAINDLFKFSSGNEEDLSSDQLLGLLHSQKKDDSPKKDSEQSLKTERNSKKVDTTPLSKKKNTLSKYHKARESKSPNNKRNDQLILL